VSTIPAFLNLEIKESINSNSSSFVLRNRSTLDSESSILSIISIKINIITISF